ncbi:MAG TPA: Flp family type IVb pilin [Acidimicrobiales bacterium]|nr:Flp family type IVb pilin [Acidimicrobiales bacterium]
MIFQKHLKISDAGDDCVSMITLYTFVQSWLDARRDDDRGASLVEYALLVALIAVVCIAAISLLGGAASDKFSTVSNSLSN